MADEIEPLREQFLDAAQALLDAERKDDASVVSASEVRKLPNGLELVAETSVAETGAQENEEEEAKKSGSAGAAPAAGKPAESPDDPPCP